MTDAAKISTLIVDDEPVARAGLMRLLAEIEWIDVVGEAADGLTAVEMIDAQKPDLVLVDISLAGASGIDLIKSIKSEYDDLPILVAAASAEITAPRTEE